MSVHITEIGKNDKSFRNSYLILSFFKLQALSVFHYPSNIHHVFCFSRMFDRLFSMHFLKYEFCFFI